MKTKYIFLIITQYHRRDLPGGSGLTDEDVPFIHELTITVPGT